MASKREQFWNHSSFAVVGHGGGKDFPTLTYKKLKGKSKRVFPVDTIAKKIGSDTTYPDFASLPEKVEAAVLEVPREETARWISQAADAGVRHIWIHMGRDTPEALAIAAERGLDVLSGTCAVMYLSGPSYHSIHKWINKALRKY
jgi:uncharacterized protein